MENVSDSNVEIAKAAIDYLIAVNLKPDDYERLYNHERSALEEDDRQLAEMCQPNY